MNLTKPSVEAALRASIKKNDKGFTVRDMMKAWGCSSVRTARERVQKLVDEGVYEPCGLTAVRDVMGRPHYAPMYQVVKKKKKA